MADDAKRNGLAGLRVLCLESRRAQEMAKLIANYGGEPIVAPSMQEVTLKDNPEALSFARKLAEGGFDIVIFLTGVGTRALVRLVEAHDLRQKFVEALRRVKVVARGPKPAAALAELGVPVTVAVPEPNTWREVLSALDARPDSSSLKGSRVAVQEYGAKNPELLAGLSERGARVTRVPVYEWALPADTGPLRDSVQAIANGRIDIAFFTTSVQVQHLLRIAGEMQAEEPLRRAFQRIVVGSIGPMTSEALRREWAARRLRARASEDGISGCGGGPAWPRFASAKKRCAMNAEVARSKEMAGPYRADHVGSFLRPAELLEARRNGKDPQRLHELEDRHIARVLAKQKELGFEIFTDGELRRRNFMSDFTDAVEGFDLGDSAGPHVGGG